MTTERDEDVFAAQYVLGLLSSETQAAADRRLISDAAFAGQVAAWRERLAAFDHTAVEVQPTDALWVRIERDIDLPRQMMASSRPRLLHRFWTSLDALRVTAVAVSAAALAFAVVAAVSVQQAREIAARKPIYVAILIDDATRQAGAVINAFADGRAEMIPLTDIAVPEGRALEIWTLWDRAVGPRSIALIDRARTTPLDLQKLPATSADQLFEITLEPVGGSPTGRPTGPILFKGTTARAL